MVLPSSSARASSSTVYPVSVSSLHQHPNSHHACFPTSKPNHENAPKCIKSPKFPRRFLIFLPASFFLLHTPSSFAIDDVKSPSTSTIDTTITDRVYMDFSVCPSYFRSDRTLGTELSSCPDSEPLGRVVFGLYGRLLPATTANFKATCTSAAYRGTLVHKLLQGQFFAAGRQGSGREKGGVQPPSDLVRNSETVDPKAFELCHARPGTLSLCLGQNDDDDDIKLNPDYHNVEFLVTTGPGPCPELDGQNIVFGTVLEGDGLSWWLTCIYGPQGTEAMSQFLHELRGIRQNCHGPWLIGGDFNMICSEADKNNQNLDRAMMGRFRRWINDMNLKELPLHGRQYTRSNGYNNPTLVRLRVFCSVEWEEAFPDCLLQSSATQDSDHCPLILGLHDVKRGKRRFHFEAF